MISREKMIALYSAMVKYRALAAQTHGVLPASWQLAPGLEATVAAVTADLKRNDSLVTTGSALAWAFVAGMKLKDLSSVLRNAHPSNGHVPLSAHAHEFASALEAAEVLNGSKSDAVALLLCESRIKADLWRKQLQRASRNNLPLVLVRFTPQKSAERNGHGAPDALAFGVPSIAVDAHDVLAVYRVASESIARARHRRGPTLIDCVDFTHTAIATKHSTKRSSDAVGTMEVHLTKKRILNTSLKQKINATVARDVGRALRTLGA